MSETTVAGGEEVDAALVAKIRVQEENTVEVDGLSNVFESSTYEQRATLAPGEADMATSA